MVIGNSIVAGLRRYSTVCRTFFSRYKTFYLGIRRDPAVNVLWCVNDIVLPKSFRSVVMHCSTNNNDTTYSDKISLSTAAIGR